MKAMVKSRSRTAKPAFNCRVAVAPPAYAASVYAPAPTPNAIRSDSDSAMSIPTVEATLPTAALFERIEFLNSAHFSHASARS
jgi:hypothetical protein